MLARQFTSEVAIRDAQDSRAEAGAPCSLRHNALEECPLARRVGVLALRTIKGPAGSAQTDRALQSAILCSMAASGQQAKRRKLLLGEVSVHS